MVEPDQLLELISTRHEWLLVRELGKSFALEASEIEVSAQGGRTFFGFLDDVGFHSWRLNEFTLDGNEIEIVVAGAFAKKKETIRLIPRTAAADLAAEIELARLKKANDLAELIEQSFAGAKLGRVALNKENGRLAQINFETAERRSMAALSDVTGTMVAESIFSTAILWLEKLGARKKKPVSGLWIICEKRHARAAQKLHALLAERWRKNLTVLEIDRRNEPPRLKEMPKRKIRDLWREKANKLVLPHSAAPSETAQKIINLSPGKTDIVISRQGETLRFQGLPLARVRAVMGREKAWFGIGRDRSILTDENWNDLGDLVATLETNRRFDPPSKRHEFYRAAPEAWLESLLRRNISQLDANLILSPIYNQFRSSNDKIDLLALRRDGRLVIIELKTQPDREMIFQAADYWRKIELQRRRGILAAADLFDGREIADNPALVYLAAPAWSFHRDFEFFARCVSPEIELWRFELHQNWRKKVRVLARQNYSGSEPGFVNR